MNKLIYIVSCCFLFTGCAVMVNSPDENSTKKTPVVEQPQHIAIKTGSYFPFENNTNWWRFTETAGNQLDIRVTDTISDDRDMYYKVSFREHQVDTTDDWFKRDPSQITFGSSLRGKFETFIPSYIDSINGSFTCESNRVRYTYKDTSIINGIVFKKTLNLKYSVPIIHGFEEIMLADSIGIVQMKDYNGRWTINYTIDSCNVNGVVKHF